jgi:hypothetical protein
MHQNRRFYANTYKAPVLQGVTKELYTLVVFLFIVKDFFKQAKPVSLKKIAIELKIPPHIVQELIESMIIHGMLIESIKPKSCFIPAKPLAKIQLADMRSIIHQAAVVQSAPPAEINDPLFKAAGLILSGSGTETELKTMDTIIPML